MCFKKTKTRLAIALLESHPKGFIVSVQVLNEFINIANQVQKDRLPRTVAHELRQGCEKEFTVHELTSQVYQLDRSWYLTNQLSLWDSLIVASANLAACTTLYSEDMNDGQRFGNVTSVNPFASLEQD